MILAFTGHRPDKLGGWTPRNLAENKIRFWISELLQAQAPDLVISGMALGVDQWACEETQNLQIPVLAALPFKGQESKWPLVAQQKYQELLSKCSKIHVVSEGQYSPGVMQNRNMWMVDKCELLAAVWDGSLGGTYNCIQYATQVGRKTINILTPERMADIFPAWKPTSPSKP